VAALWYQNIVVMTNILIPTDFTANSLKQAEGVLRNESCPKCNIVLFHAFEMPEPFDMLYKLYRDPSLEFLTESFRQSCKQIKDENPDKIGKIIVRCLKGSTRAIFRNFIEANDIDLIYCPEDYVFTRIHEQSIDPLPLFKKCGVPVIKTVSRRTPSVFATPVFSTVPITAQ
jgi:hypothetical protein